MISSRIMIHTSVLIWSPYSDLELLDGPRDIASYQQPPIPDEIACPALYAQGHDGVDDIIVVFLSVLLIGGI